MGSDMAGLLDKQMVDKLNSWAIRWRYHQFKYDLLSIHPVVSKIENIGFNSPDATNTKEIYNRFGTALDIENKITFHFSTNTVIESRIIKQFTKPYSITSRIKYKTLNLLRIG